MADESPKSEIILYQTEDGRTRIQCRFESETIWLTQKLMAELFQIGVNTVHHHLKELYAEGELEESATIRRYRMVHRTHRKGGLHLSRQSPNRPNSHPLKLTQLSGNSGWFAANGV